ncbi:DJ-1/PfpI family protein [Ottowia sp.]|uniref:DJ-1/PfpI family protein n=1 Tax=Ottowia sp. TaxID=1898956 RepID=UPI0025CC3AA8|nr:DJ-1/PfpI family protein [Ottowia sp.]
MPRPSPSSPRPPPHRVVCLAFPGVMSLDVLGPLQVFATANDLRRKHGQAPRYRVEVAGPQAGVVLTSAGIGLMATRAWAAVRGGADCTVLVPGGDGIDAAVRETPLLAVLQRLAPRVGRLGSVCSGALALGQAGAARRGAGDHALVARRATAPVRAARHPRRRPAAHL